MDTCEHCGVDSDRFHHDDRCPNNKPASSGNSDLLLRQLDRPYHKKNLEIILRDLNNYTPDELSRALLRLAVVADPLVLSEQEFMKARIDAMFAKGLAQ